MDIHDGHGNQYEAHDDSDGDSDDDGVALLVKEIYILGKRQVVVPHNQPIGQKKHNQP